MEDYAPLLWILFIVASMAITAITKGKEAAQQKAKASAQNTPSVETPSTTTEAKTHKRASTIATNFNTALTSERSKTAVTPLLDVINEPEESLMEDFDLRKAVICAEILNPKFDQ